MYSRALGLLIACISQIHAAQVIYEKNLNAQLLAVDTSGNAYAASSGTITKLSPDGTIVYSRAVPLPGTWSGIAVDRQGNIMITGATADDNLPGTSGTAQPKRNASGRCITGDRAAAPYPCPDAFVAKLNSDAQITWATYLGGSLQDQANAIAVDASGNIYVTGVTQSPDFPNTSAFQTTFGGYADAFVTKISADGTRFLYSSFLGGPAYDVAHAIAVDDTGNAYIAGDGGTGLPTTTGSFGPTCASNAVTAFLVKVAPAGNRLVFAGCLGSTMTSSSATALAVD